MSFGFSVRRRLRWIPAALIAIAFGAACTGSGSGGGHLDPKASAVLKSYRAWWADYGAATRSFPVDPANPRLADHMNGPELSQIRAQLTYMKTRSQTIRGPLVDISMATVSSLGPTTATVQDCYLDSSYLVNGNTGKLENQPLSERVLARIDLTQDVGLWKVARFTTVQIGCSHA